LSRLHIQQTDLLGLAVITRTKQDDSRGGFLRIFCADELLVAGWHLPVAQINHSITIKKGTIRGIHFQRHPHAEMKLVQCLKCEVWDVAVDLRPTSPTYLKWHGELLSAHNCRALLIPEGFAHGFQTLAPECELLYLHSASYNAQAEAGLRFDDPSLSIDWPLPVTDLSERDKQLALISQHST